MLLKDLPKTHDDLASVYDYIGELNMRTTNWKEALKNFELAEVMKRKKRCWWNHPDIKRTWNNIGNYYKAIEDNTQAHQYYTKALQCTSNPTDIIIIHPNISSIYEMNKDYEEALNLCFGHIYLSQKNYDIAEGYYLAAFEMSQQFLVPGDRLQTCCL
jgi:tetratricopeptide (TPR) repeat protein